jgi:hypothetical protein
MSADLVLMPNIVTLQSIAGGMTAVTSTMSAASSGSLENPFLCSHASGTLLPGDTQIVTFTYKPLAAGMVLQPLRFVTTPPLPPSPRETRTPTIDDAKRTSSTTTPTPTSLSSSSDTLVNDTSPTLLLRGIGQTNDEGSVRRKEILAQLNRYHHTTQRATSIVFEVGDSCY